MDKRIVLLDWQEAIAEGVSGKFKESGWKVELDGNNRQSTYQQVLKKSPAVLLCYTNNLTPILRENCKPLKKRKLSIPAFGLL
jgi:hypothetical protein